MLQQDVLSAVKKYKTSLLPTRAQHPITGTSDQFVLTRVKFLEPLQVQVGLD